MKTQIRIHTTLLLLLFFSHNSIAKFKGIYTVDSSKSSSKTNYRSLDELTNDYILGTRKNSIANGPDMDSDVIIRLADGNYYGNPIALNQKFHLTIESINGDSSKVWFIKRDYYKMEIGYNTTVRKIGLLANSFESGGGNFYNCIIRGINRFDTVLNSTNFMIYSNTTIMNCHISNLTNAISINNFSDYNCVSVFGDYQNIKIEGNLIDSVAQGISTYRLDDCGHGMGDSNLIIKNNIILLSNKKVKGIYRQSSGIFILNGRNVEISNNKIIALACNGIILNANKNLTLFNNMVTIDSSDHQNGIQVIGTDRTNSVNKLSVCNNTIYLKNSHKICFGLYLFVANNKDNVIKNNLIKSNGDSSVSICLNIPKDTSKVRLEIKCDYNSYNDTTTLFGAIPVFGNVFNFFSLKNWQKQTNLDSHSFYANPTFISNADLHTNSYSVFKKGTPVNNLKFDIDGDKRDSLHPCIGADEFYTYTNINSVGFNEKEDIKIYPNPSSNLLNINIAGEDKYRIIRIFNAQGILIDNFNASNNRFQINTLKFSNGLYFLNLDGNTIKFIKE